MISLLIAGAVAMAVALLATPLFIAWLRDRGIGQQIRQDGPQGHHVKAGTPTMGGLCIVVATLIGYAVAHSRIGAVYTRTGLVVMLAIVGSGALGFADDWIKVRNGRSLGLSTVQKLGGQALIATVFAVLAVQWADVNTELSWTRVGQLGITLPKWGWVIFAVVVIMATANAVNLTDGLDGLAAGASSFPFAAFAAIGYWELRNPEIYHSPHALDLALLSCAMAASCLGFLWWNAAPARIFMGDTGSLAIGTGMGALALVLHLQLLLPMIGGLFVVETLSVIMQVISFRMFGGRRLFRMAPIHHHFELKGWPETHVIVRFWIIAALFTVLALGFFYADFLAIKPS